MLTHTHKDSSCLHTILLAPSPLPSLSPHAFPPSPDAQIEFIIPVIFGFIEVFNDDVTHSET